MRARRLTAAELAVLPPEALAGAVLLAPVRLSGRPLPKGARLTSEHSQSILDAARGGRLDRPVRLAWPEAGDLHEDEAAESLARAVVGEGVEPRPPRQSRLDLAARWDGVLHVDVDGLARVNALDPLEVFTLLHGQAVSTGQVVASVKVAPHLVAGEVVAEGVRRARERAPVIEVRPYLALEVAALVEELIDGEALARFEAGARLRVGALGGRFAGTTAIGDPDPVAAEAIARAALEELARRRRIPVLLVGGVSAGDPLAPFFAALEGLGGRVLRRGVPAHPGSMVWLAALEETTLLGLPQCGMFSMATAADLVLPRLLTGERLDAGALADLGHGGILTRDMRFRFPAYARELETPQG